MIDPKELRIGNLVLLYNDECAITEIGYKESHLESEHFVTTAIFDIIDPIPITPEWLERLGFGKEERETGLPQGRETAYRIKVDKKTLLVVWFDPLEVELGHYFSTETTLMDHIKSIHQLQNIYHALTGDKLTIRPE